MEHEIRVNRLLPPCTPARPRPHAFTASAAEYERVLRESLDEVDRLGRLAEDLLVLSRATAGSGLVRARVDLEPLVLEALDLGARLAHGTGVAVWLGAVEPAAVTGDQAALSRLLRNLVENAAS